MRIFRFIFPLITLGLVVAAIISILGRSHTHTIPVPPTTSTPPQASQVWYLTEQSERHQVAWIIIKPFTHQGDFVEDDNDPGWWMYGTQGEKLYKFHLGGNVVPASPNDRWDFLGLSGVGGGYDSMGSAQGTFNGKYPTATTASGTITLKTTSPLGTYSDTITWTAVRIK